MLEYRRVFLKGGTYFITIVTYQRGELFTNPQARKFLHHAFVDVKFRFPLKMDAVCLLPDHIYVLMRLPEDDADYPMRIREIKRLFTKAYLNNIGPGAPRNESRQKKHEAAIWQRRYWEHLIRDEKDLNTHIDYIHYNQVKHGLVHSVAKWKWSSFHRYVKEGVCDPEWGKGLYLIKKIDILANDRIGGLGTHCAGA